MSVTREIVIGDRVIGDNHPCMIVAEISCNHLQDKNMALRLIKEARIAGADAVKFQAYTPDTMTLDPSGMADSERQNFIIQGSIWEGQSFYELYKEAFTPWEWFGDLKTRAEEEGLFFLVTPFDESSVDLLEEIGVEAYKIASFEINHVPLLKKVAATNKPVIFSTGVAERQDIELALETLKGNLENPQIIILKCTSAYPAPMETSNLATIRDLRSRYNTLVGLSDHTVSPNVPAYAVALGACMVEKHFTLEKKGPDAQFSLTPKEFAEMAETIRECESAMGKITYDLTEKIREHRAFVRSIFASESIAAGARFSETNIRVVRPGAGLHPKYYSEILGRKAARDIRFGEPIKWDMVDA